jgi:hypothetical protein
MFLSHFEDHFEGAHGQYFVKLPSSDPLLYVRYGIVHFAAVCHYLLTPWNRVILEKLTSKLCS